MRAALLAALAAAPLPAWGYPDDGPLGEVFRRSVDRDRDFDLGPSYFLDSLHYDFPDSWDMAWERPGNGLRATGGSIHNDEMFLRTEARVRDDLDEDWGYGYRYLQGQDFDGTWRRSLLSAGRDLPWDGQEAGLVADLDPAKEEIDLGATWALRGEGNDRIEALAYWTDPLFNQKTDAPERYRRDAWTLGLSGRRRMTPDLDVWGSVTVTPSVEIDRPDRGYTLFYRRRTITLNGRWALPGELWGCTQTLRGKVTKQEADRRRDAWLPGDLTESHMQRDAWGAQVEYTLHHPGDPATGKPGRAGPRAGFEWVEFHERDEYPAPDGRHRIETRREAIPYAAVPLWRSDRWNVEPALYLDRIQYRVHTPNAPAGERKRSALDSKLAASWNYFFAGGATFRAGGSMDLDRPSFGGAFASVSLAF
ncbi:MAG: hypothetical protein HY608_04035 [Planctomycetes bacterium]|nr:hypothetical protein [Planctomycetota bacterium]